jgi:hypothetical protein
MQVSGYRSAIILYSIFYVLYNLMAICNSILTTHCFLKFSSLIMKNIFHCLIIYFFTARINYSFSLTFFFFYYSFSLNFFFFFYSFSFSYSYIVFYLVFYLFLINNCQRYDGCDIFRGSILLFHTLGYNLRSVWQEGCDCVWSYR